MAVVVYAPALALSQGENAKNYTINYKYCNDNYLFL